MEEATEDTGEEEEPEWTLRCPVQMDAPFEGEVDFTEFVPQGEKKGVFAMPQTAEVRGGMLLVEAVDPANKGDIRIPGYPDMDWKPPEDGGCPTLSFEGVSAVVGRITPSWGKIGLHACGTLRYAEPDGSFYVPASPGECTVRPFRNDSGGVSVEGEVVTVQVLEGQDTVLELTVPEEEWGSLGLMLEDKGEVAIVRDLWEGSVADEAGIQVGDVLVTINGESPVDCDRGWLFNCFHGPLGSGVSLEFKDGETVELTRGRLPKETTD
jgi:hypothetical protein